jgi:type II secretory pathway component GspD/PulD (secretin)
MKTALGFSLVILSSLGNTKAAPPDPKAPQIYIAAKFVEVTRRDSDPSDGTSLPAPLDDARGAPGPLGPLTDPQFQKVIRELSRQKGVDLMSAPGLTTRSGQQAKAEMINKFAYKDEAGKPATMDLGIALTVLPRIKVGNELELDFSPQVVEHDRSVKHESGWEEPLFKVRKANMSVVITSGHTFVLELDPRTDKQLVEDRDERDRLISTTTEVFHRRLFVFVTATILDPAADKKPAR